MKDIKVIYPYAPWSVTEEKFKTEDNYKNETIFALANGYIGTRGTFEEGYNGPEKTGIEGTFINGFYESEVIKYGEKGHGYADLSQTMLNVPNGKKIIIKLDDEKFDMLNGEIEEYSRTLDMKKGYVIRELVWKSNEGRSARFQFERLVSMERKNIIGIKVTVFPLENVQKVSFTSFIDGDVINDTPTTNARIDYGPYDRVLDEVSREIEGSYMELQHKTRNTELTMITGVEHVLGQGLEIVENIENEYEVGIHVQGNAEIGQAYSMEKFICYSSNVNRENADLKEECKSIIEAAKQESFDGLLEEQERFMEEFWKNADIVINGDEALQQGIRFNMFHLLQTCGRDGKTSIGAKGLTGEGYEGHCFWDTEMYALPFFLYTNPEMAKKLIEFRYHTLDGARERAREMSHETGALYPWRTINGKEASPYFPAGTAQYHINADIAFAVQKYFEVTNDEEFYKDVCIEILVETARFWCDYGDYIPTKGNKFCINGVTGPDEYTAIVNNNCYTNMLAKENLLNAAVGMNWLKENYEEAYRDLCERLEVGDNEICNWINAGENMFIPYNEELGIYAQDDSFFDKKVWDIENTPKDKFPLLDNYHPLVIYRQQVCKQADLVLVTLLLNHKFSQEDIKKAYDYYEKVTVHESSLSFCIYSIIAAQIGYKKQAYDYFMASARLDLDDYHKNTNAGIHTANLAGTWMCIVNGFGGMRMDGETLSFNPYLPEGWRDYKFRVAFNGSLIEVSVDENGASYELVEGSEISFKDGDRDIVLK